MIIPEVRAKENPQELIDRIKKSIKTLVNSDILVGVSAMTDLRAGKIGNAALAYIHDQGSPANNIPQREFMRPGIEMSVSNFMPHLKKAGVAVLHGKFDSMQASFEMAGQVARDSIKMKIVVGPFEPLKPATLKAREKNGRMGSKPLIDTTQLLSSITYVIRTRG